MAVLIHITDQRNERAIRRSGLKRGRNGVYAVPVTADFMSTHQWARELKRWRAKTPLAVYFRMPGDTPVRAGHYNGPHREITLKEAIAEYLERDRLPGFEIIFSRSVPKSNIIRTRRFRRPVGWRFYPEAKGRLPPIGPYLRGKYGAAKIRARLDPPMTIPPFEALKKIIETEDDPEELSFALRCLASKRRRASCDFLEPLLTHPDPDLQFDLLDALQSFSDPLAKTFIERLSGSADAYVSAAAGRVLIADDD